MPTMYLPTAQQSVVLSQETASSELNCRTPPVALMLSLVTADHAVPFHSSMSV